MGNNGKKADKPLLQSTRLKESIRKFTKWHLAFGDFSYDRMDYWSSGLGVFAKKVFYKNKLLGAPFALLGLMLENFFPNVQKLCAKPHREVIGDAHFASAYLNLYQSTENPAFLVKAESLLEDMMLYASTGYSGLCWGYNFGWQTPTGYWEKQVPLITITPYAFWAFKKHFEITNNSISKERCLSIANFALHDLKEQQMPNGTYCSSYSPTTQDVVINANTYRAAVLYGAFHLSGNIEYKEVADRNIEFVLSYQGKSGEWYYEAKPKEDNFIDNFHTCFVLRNLYLCYQINNDQTLLESIKKGYNYYRSALFNDKSEPKHFAVAKYMKLRKYELYDYAEGIYLGALMKEEIPEALEFSEKLAAQMIEKFQLSSGYFVTRVTSFGTRHKVPYLRWPQAQIFYSLTELDKICVEL